MFYFVLFCSIKLIFVLFCSFCSILFVFVLFCFCFCLCFLFLFCFVLFYFILFYLLGWSVAGVRITSLSLSTWLELELRLILAINNKPKVQFVFQISQPAKIFQKLFSSGSGGLNNIPKGLRYG